MFVSTKKLSSTKCQFNPTDVKRRNHYRKIPICGATDTPVFGLLVTFALGFKAKVDPSLACFVACVQWIPTLKFNSVYLSQFTCDIPFIRRC